MTIVTALVAWQLHVTHTHKVAVRYTYLEGDVAWAGHHLRVLPALSVAAGVAAGLLGIGGGMVRVIALDAIGTAADAIGGDIGGGMVRALGASGALADGPKAAIAIVDGSRMTPNDAQLRR